MTEKSIKAIEVMTQGQNTNQNWYHHRKGVITASKAHDVKTKMTKIMNNLSVSSWALDQKISGLVFVSPDIPALKYGRSMEEFAANCFLDRGAPYIGGSPDRIVVCSCCKPACLKMKCLYSINYTTPMDPNVDLPYICKETMTSMLLTENIVIIHSVLVQKAITGYESKYFMVWTPHGLYTRSHKI